MVKHIVLFKLKDEAPADEKLAAMNSFKAAIEALPAKISVIRKIEVGLNINPAEAWSIALYSEFDTLDDVKYYAAHPDHVAAGKLIAAVKESRACVDYEIIVKLKNSKIEIREHEEIIVPSISVAFHGGDAGTDTRSRQVQVRTEDCGC